MGITFLALLCEAGALRGVGAIRVGVGKSGHGLIDDGAQVRAANPWDFEGSTSSVTYGSPCVNSTTSKSGRRGTARRAVVVLGPVPMLGAEGGEQKRCQKQIQ